MCVGDDEVSVAERALNLDNRRRDGLTRRNRGERLSRTPSIQSICQNFYLRVSGGGTDKSGEGAKLTGKSSDGENGGEAQMA